MGFDKNLGSIRCGKRNPAIARLPDAANGEGALFLAAVLAVESLSTFAEVVIPAVSFVDL